MFISQLLFTQPVFLQHHPEYSHKSYVQAIDFIRHKSPTIHRLIRNDNRASFLTALALPGIMRAIRFSNLLKIKFMEWKYIHFGHLLVDYAVGDLQMRLSMAEEIEQYLKNNPLLQSKAGLLLYPQVAEKNIRYMRLKRMYSFEWQLRYLRAFDVMMRRLFSKVGFDDTLQKLRFYAHIYYYGSLFKQEMKNEHPAPFPVALIDRTVASTYAQIILDPFMGSGTTAVVAMGHNRNYIGIEILPDYCQMAEQRIERNKKHSELNLISN